MKHAAAVAALFALLALPAMAQRGGARGGSGGHASGGFAGHAGGFGGHAGGGFAAPHFSGFQSRGPGLAPHFGGFAPRYGSFSPRFGSYAPRGYAPRGYAPRGFMAPGRTGFAPRSRAFTGRMPYRSNGYGRLGNAHAAYNRNRHGGDHDRHSHRRRPYYNGFNGLPYAYGYAGLPWYGFEIDPWSLGPDWLDYDDDSTESAQNEMSGNVPAPYPDYGESGPAYGEPGPEYDQPAPQGYAQQPYPQTGSGPNLPQAAPSSSPRQPYTSGSAAPEPQQAVTLIFKNGHPPETVHNYMLTASTLTVLDGKYQQIPVSQIDLPATVAANRAQGINFQVPNAAN